MGRGHTILGNFSIDRMVIELTKNIKITIQTYRRTLKKHREAKIAHGLNLGKFEKRRPTFLQIYISLYQNVIYKAGKSFSVVMWP